MSINSSFLYKYFLFAALAFYLFACGQKEEQKGTTLFQQIHSAESNIDFENTIKDTDEFNIIEYLYFYNGGGVSTGDINNDGLVDIYFTSNQGSNKLYLNKGNFEFEDITKQAGVDGTGNWTTGVTMADVNADGLLDIFVCGVGNYKSFNGRNQLFINKGNLTFAEQAVDYGLSFQGFSTQTAFFDYDNDGDLDMYLLNHSVHTKRSYGDVSLRFQTDALAGDKLYRNQLVPTGKTYFEDVSMEAGILNSQIGYGLGLGISDLNNDGFLDIYVSNDFHENDYLYINQKNGTFKQELEKSFTHSSRFSMGSDIGDINNDGWNDIVTLDMLPKDESILKTSGGEDTYEIFNFKLNFGYHYQVARNSLQLNRGINPNGNLWFIDVAPYARVEATDWSWGPLLADFDNDGFRDFFVANGIVRRPNDLDYINYISTDSAQRFLSTKQMIDKMPTGKVPNYFFRNNGKLGFEEVSESWLGSTPSLSNGAAYADFDNDGDLDLVVNNINEAASVYRNETPNATNYLAIQLEGNAPNTFGIGAKVLVYSNHMQSMQELIPTRGWLSSSSYKLHFGLGNEQNIDSLIVIWPDKHFEKIDNLKPNQILNLKQENAKSVWNFNHTKDKKLLEVVEKIDFRHIEDEYSDFETERLIPHALSTQGPKMAIGDVNGDRLEDVFITGAKNQPTSLFLQTAAGVFNLNHQVEIESDSLNEDTAAVLFDVDNDKDLDLVVVSTGQPNVMAYTQPRLYINKGNGKFTKSIGAFNDISVSSTCVVHGDFDNDGDIDLFVGGRVVTGSYGITPKSYLFTNNGVGLFTDDSHKLPQSTLGMVTSAVWTDLDSNGKLDLVVVGEWMPITFLIQEPSGNFIDQTSKLGFSNTHGWWNVINEADVDGDGDLDFLVGNAGLNSRFRVTLNEPVELWVGDIDGNGSSDPILTYYNNHKRYPFITKDQLIKQVPMLKRKFLRYEDFKNVTLEDIITNEEIKQFTYKRAETFSSVWIERKHNGVYAIHDLPNEAQLFPVFAFAVDDFNADQQHDILAVGNWYEIQPELGRQDAGYGLVLLGTENQEFEALTLLQTNFFVRGQGRDIKIVPTGSGERIIFVSKNNDKLESYQIPSKR